MAFLFHPRAISFSCSLLPPSLFQILDTATVMGFRRSYSFHQASNLQFWGRNKLRCTTMSPASNMSVKRPVAYHLTAHRSYSLYLQFHWIFEKQKANLPWLKKALARMILLVQKTPEVESQVEKYDELIFFSSVKEMRSEASKGLRKEDLFNRTFWNNVNVLYLHCPIQ